MSSNKRMRLEQGACTMVEATMNALPSDVMKTIFTYVGKGSFCFIGPVSKDFCYNYLTMDFIENRNAHKLDLVLAVDRNKVTTVDAASTSMELAEHCFLNAPDWFQKELFRSAAMKGRHDIVRMAAEISGVDMNGWIGQYDIGEITKKDDLGMLVLLKEKGLNIPSWFYHIIKIAAFHGYLDILRWIHQMKGNISSYTLSLFMFAARGGHLNIIQWGMNIGCTLSKASSINDAVYSGNLELVKWFRDQNTSWNDRTSLSAVRSGNMELLQYLHVNGCVFTSQAYIVGVLTAEKETRLDVFKWLHQHNVPWDEETCKYVASIGNLDLIIYARSNGSPWGQWTIQEAVKNGHIDVVKYCIENDCPIGRTDLCRTSMQISDHEKALKVLKLLRKFEIPWNSRTCDAAAKNGNLEALKWARNEGCPWDKCTFRSAVEFNEMAIVQYCIENECPFGQDFYPSAVRCEDPIPMLKLLRFHGYEWDENACAKAASEGNLKVLRWLRYNDCPWDEEVCNEAVNNNHHDILVYAHENECPWTVETYAYCFHEEGLNGEVVPAWHKCSDAIIEYLREHDCPQPEPRDWRNIVN